MGEKQDKDRADFARGARGGAAGGPASPWSAMASVVNEPPPNTPPMAVPVHPNSAVQNAQAEQAHQLLEQGRLEWEDLPQQTQQNLKNHSALGQIYKDH